MTNKEAIEILSKSQFFLARNCGKTDMYNALDLAIKALEDRPTECNCSHCDYFKFSQAFIENIVKFMADYNIESVEDLMKELKHINELLGGRE